MRHMQFILSRMYLLLGALASYLDQQPGIHLLLSFSTSQRSLVAYLVCNIPQFEVLSYPRCVLHKAELHPLFEFMALHVLRLPLNFSGFAGKLEAALCVQVGQRGRSVIQMVGVCD